MILHFWDREEDRSPVGAAACGTRIVLALSSDRESVQLALRADGGEERILPMERRGDRFRAEFTAPEQSGLLFYRFLASGEATPPRQITVYEPCETPGWFKNALVYQIFPDRFAREAAYVPRQPEKRRGSYRFLVPDWDTPPFYPRDERQAVSAWPFWGGTLRGMEEKLDYLASLGVSCLYLNPIFEACSSHRYDTGDYERIDSLLGTEEDFGRLCERARERGIRILLDGVFSHTGADSRYFDRCGNYGTGERYREWFRFGEQYPHGYECWWNVPDLPNVEELRESYLEYICGENGILRRWLRLGASGWRLDVADELPDEFIRAVRRAVKSEKSDAVLLGEVWEDASNKESYGRRRAYFGGRELDGVMNYPLRAALLGFARGECSAFACAEALESLREHYPRENLLSGLNLLGSHDRERVLTALGGEREKLKLLSVLQYALPGVPCIYYGDEAGMLGGADPYNRGSFPWGREDAELTEHYRRLGVWYRAHPCLREGECSLRAEDEDTLVLTRWDETERITLSANRREGKIALS
ncbi:MAG: glycoside hydrolase family 13 protein [Oscillospiraceae bacterium]|nr:glycoside hydrolase family 13 protein [Oscillospiraceae bacterium]